MKLLTGASLESDLISVNITTDAFTKSSHLRRQSETQSSKKIPMPPHPEIACCYDAINIYSMLNSSMKLLIQTFTV